MLVIDKPLADEAVSNFSFEINKASGNDVIQLNDFAFTYPNETEPLFENISFTAHRGERIALIGKNGVGKTTLLNEITRSEEHTSELQSRGHLVCRLLLEKKKNKMNKR